MNFLKQWPDLICLNLVPECQGGVLALWLSNKPYRSVCLSKLCSWHHHHNQQQQTQRRTHLLELQPDLHCPLHVTWLRTLYCEEFHCLDFLPSIRSQGHSLQEGHPLQEAHSDHLTQSRTCSCCNLQMTPGALVFLGWESLFFCPNHKQKGL